MKSLQLYVCDICGTQYKDKEECKMCESGHMKAMKIHDMMFDACRKNVVNYPDKVQLEMSDGKKIWYLKSYYK